MSSRDFAMAFEPLVEADGEADPQLILACGQRHIRLLDANNGDKLCDFELPRIGSDDANIDVQVVSLPATRQCFVAYANRVLPIPVPRSGESPVGFIIAMEGLLKALDMSNQTLLRNVDNDYAKPSARNSLQSLFLEASAASFLLECLVAQMRTPTTPLAYRARVRKCRLVEQLAAALEQVQKEQEITSQSAKMRQWKSIVRLEVPQFSMLHICRTLQPVLEDSSSTALPAIISLMEQLHDLMILPSNFASFFVMSQTEDFNSQHGASTMAQLGMHLERERYYSLCTMHEDDARILSLRTDGSDVRLARLAAAGFFYQRGPTDRNGKFVHFESGVGISLTSALARRVVLSPSLEHALMAPTSRFVLQKITANVPIAESKGSSERIGLFSGQNVQEGNIKENPDKDSISLIRACQDPKTPVLATATYAGRIFLWTVTWNGLKKAFSFDATASVEVVRRSSASSPPVTTSAYLSSSRMMHSSSHSSGFSSPQVPGARMSKLFTGLHATAATPPQSHSFASGSDIYELPLAASTDAQQQSTKIYFPTEVGDEGKTLLASAWNQLSNRTVKDVCIFPKPRRSSKRYFRKHKTPKGQVPSKGFHGPQDLADSDVPNDPMYPSRSGMGSSSSKQLQWWQPYIVVEIQRGPYTGQVGYIIDASDIDPSTVTGHLQIWLHGFEEKLNISIADVKPKTPSIGDPIMVLSSSSGRKDVGKLVSTDGIKGYVKLRRRDTGAIARGRAPYLSLQRLMEADGGKLDKNAVTNRKCHMEKIFKLSPAAELGLEQQEMAVRNEGAAAECMLIVLIKHGEDGEKEGNALALFRRSNSYTELIQVLRLETPAEQVIVVPKNPMVHVVQGSTVSSYRLAFNSENLLVLDPRPLSRFKLPVGDSPLHMSLIHAPDLKFGCSGEDSVSLIPWPTTTATTRRLSVPTGTNVSLPTDTQSTSNPLSSSPLDKDRPLHESGEPGEQLSANENDMPIATSDSHKDPVSPSLSSLPLTNEQPKDVHSSTVVSSGTDDEEDDEDDEDDDDDDDEDDDEDDDDEGLTSSNATPGSEDFHSSNSLVDNTAGTSGAGLASSVAPPLVPFSHGKNRFPSPKSAVAAMAEAPGSELRKVFSASTLTSEIAHMHPPSPRFKQVPSSSSYWLAALCNDGTLLLCPSNLPSTDAAAWKLSLNQNLTTDKPTSSSSSSICQPHHGFSRLSHVTLAKSFFCCSSSVDGELVCARFPAPQIVESDTFSDSAAKDWQIRALHNLETTYEQLQWEHLPFRAFPPQRGRQRIFAVGRSGSMLRWRVQGHLGANGLETDADADDDDEDVLIEGPQVGVSSSDAAAVEGSQMENLSDLAIESSPLLTDETSTAKDEVHTKKQILAKDVIRENKSALTWELELPEPSAVSRLFVHVDLQMRQTTSASPALMFQGNPRGCARVGLRPHLTEEGSYRFLTIEAWVRPDWGDASKSDMLKEQTNTVNDSSQQYIPIVYKSTMGSDGIALPQYELSVSKTGRALFKVWKDDDVVFSTSVLKGVGTSQPELRQGEWHHLAAIVGRSGLELYVDGDLYAASELTRVSIRPDADSNQSPAGSVPQAGPLPLKNGTSGTVAAASVSQSNMGSASSPAYRYGALCIGGDGESRSFRGYLRHVRLWAMSRTQEQVRDWMHHSVGPSVASGRVSAQMTTVNGATSSGIRKEDLRVQVDQDHGGVPRSKVESILSLGESVNLIGCWPCTETGGGGVLPVHQGTVDEASDAVLSDPKAASWVNVQVPLVDYKPSLALSASLVTLSGSNDVLLDRQPLEGCEVSFDLGAHVGTRLSITLYPSPSENLATVTGVSLSLKGRLSTSAARYREHLQAVDNRDLLWIPLTSLSAFWKLCVSGAFTRALVDIATNRRISYAGSDLPSHDNQGEPDNSSLENDLSGDGAISDSQEPVSESMRLGALRLLEYQLQAGVTRCLEFLDGATLERFMRTNFVDAPNSALGAEVAEQGGALLLHLLNACDTEQILTLRGMILDLALQVLGDASDHADTVEGVEQLTALIARCWPVKGTKLFDMAFTSVMEQLCSIGDELDNNRSAHHNMLRTFFTNFSRPLNEPFIPHGRGRGPLLTGDFAETSGSNADGSSGNGWRPFKAPKLAKTEIGSKVHKSQGAAIAAAVNNAANSNNYASLSEGSVAIHSKTSNSSLQVLDGGIEIDKRNKSSKASPKARQTAATISGSQPGDISDSSSVQIKFTNVLHSQKDSIMVLNLGNYCTITNLSAVPFIESLSPWMSGMLTVEAWRSRPPIAGERSLIKADGVEVELYAFSGSFTYDRDGTIGVKSHFPTVVPRNVMLYSGKWYYEVQLVKTSDGVAQIGWADAAFQGSDDDSTGTGDDEHSWAYDGHRQKKWNNGCHSWGNKWSDGFIVGCAADIDNRVLSFSLNGVWARPMGVAFKNINITGGLFPAITGERNFRCQVNFGQKPFVHSVPDGHRPVFDWIKQNKHIVESTGTGKPVTTAESFASQRVSPVVDLTGLSQSSISSDLYAHSQSAPMLSIGRFPGGGPGVGLPPGALNAFSGVSQSTSSSSGSSSTALRARTGVTLIRCAVRGGQTRQADLKDTCFIGQCEARYLRIVFSPHYVIPTIPAMVLYSRAPLPTFQDDISKKGISKLLGQAHGNGEEADVKTGALKPNETNTVLEQILKAHGNVDSSNMELLDHEDEDDDEDAEEDSEEEEEEEDEEEGEDVAAQSAHASAASHLLGQGGAQDDDDDISSYAKLKSFYNQGPSISTPQTTHTDGFEDLTEEDLELANLESQALGMEIAELSVGSSTGAGTGASLHWSKPSQLSIHEDDDSGKAQTKDPDDVKSTNTSSSSTNAANAQWLGTSSSKTQSTTEEDQIRQLKGLLAHKSGYSKDQIRQLKGLISSISISSKPKSSSLSSVSSVAAAAASAADTLSLLTSPKSTSSSSFASDLHAYKKKSFPSTATSNAQALLAHAMAKAATGGYSGSVSGSSSSSKRRSRQGGPDANVTVKLYVEGIRDAVPLVYALPDKLRSTHLMEHKSVAESNFVTTSNEVERARRNLELALERFSGSIGTATGGVWDGIDTSQMTWEAALQELGEDHPLYHAVAAVKTALLDGVLTKLGESEVTRERLDYLHSIIARVVEEERNAQMDRLLANKAATSLPSDTSSTRRFGDHAGEPLPSMVEPVPSFLESVELIRPSRQPTLRVSRWYRMVELLTSLLVRKFPDEMEDDILLMGSEITERRPFLSLPLLHKIFSHFCVHHTCSAEQIRVTGKLVRRGLRALSLYDETASATFVCDVLREHFSIPSIFLGISQAFPERPVFNLLKAIVEGPNATLAVQHLLALLDSVGSSSVNEVLDNFPLVSWTMVLLSHALESEARSLAERAMLPASALAGARAIHPNTVCAVCGATPIVGPRYHSVSLSDYDLCELCEGAGRYPDETHVFLKIPRPLPLPSTADQPRRLPVGPLLPGLRTMLPAEVEAQKQQHQSDIQNQQLEGHQHQSDANSMALDSKLAPTVSGQSGASDIMMTSSKVDADDDNDSSANVASSAGASMIGDLGLDKKHNAELTDSDSDVSDDAGKTTPMETVAGPVHEGTACDGCGMKPIVGIRFKCVNCDEYDLCARCESVQESRRSHFAMHAFVKLRAPLPDESDKTSEALIPEQSLVATLLHPSLYHKVRRAEQELEALTGSRQADAAGTVWLDSDGQSTSAPGSAGKSVSRMTPLSVDGEDPTLIKLARRRSHILNTTGRFGKPSVLNPFHAAALSASESSVLDSPPSRRIRGSRVFAGVHMEFGNAFLVDDDDDRTDDGNAPSSAEDNDALRIILGLITSPALLAPLQLELFLITAKVLEQIAARASTESVKSGFLEQSVFDDLLRRTANLSEPFVHASILRIIETLCSKPGNQSVRAALREKTIAVLSPPPQAPAFVLELLLIALGPTEGESDSLSDGSNVEPLNRATSELPAELKPHPLRRNASVPSDFLPGSGDDRRQRIHSPSVSGEPIRAVDHDAAPLEDLSPSSFLDAGHHQEEERLDSRSVAQILCVFQNSPLRSAPRARAWAFAFRILRKFCEPEAMLLGEGKARLDAAIQSVLTAGAAMVALLESDLVLLVRSLLVCSRGHVHVIFQKGLLDMLVDAFLVASPVNPRLYRRLVLALTESFTTDVDPASGLEEAPLISLVEAVSTAIGTEAHVSTEALAKPDLDLLREVLELVCAPLRKTDEQSDAAAHLRQALLDALTVSREGAPAPVHSLLEWLSDPPQSSENTRVARQRLSEMIVMLLSEVLGRENAAAAPLLEICVSALRDPHAGHPEPVAAVIYALISREAMATHLVLSRASLELGVGNPQDISEGLMLRSRPNNANDSSEEDSIVASRTRARIMASVSHSICQALSTPSGPGAAGGSSGIGSGSSQGALGSSGVSAGNLLARVLSRSQGNSSSRYPGIGYGSKITLPDCLMKRSGGQSAGPGAGPIPFDISSLCMVRQTSGHPSCGNAVQSASAEKVTARLAQLIGASNTSGNLSYGRLGFAMALQSSSSVLSSQKKNQIGLSTGVMGPKMSSLPSGVSKTIMGSGNEIKGSGSMSIALLGNATSKKTSSSKTSAGGSGSSSSKSKAHESSSESRGQAKPVQYVFGRGANEKWSITLELPCDSIVHALELDFHSDVTLGSSSSTSTSSHRPTELPSRIAVETGNAISRMSPSGITSNFPCKAQHDRSVGTATICLAAPVTARFVRIIVFPPPEADFVPSLAPKTLAETTGHSSSSNSTTKAATSLGGQFNIGGFSYGGSYGKDNGKLGNAHPSKTQQTLYTKPLPGDLIVRGPDWKWGVQDGGLGTRGKVLSITSWGGIPGKAVRVKWPSGAINAYRWGYVEHGEAKYDLMHVPKKEPSRQRVVILARLGLYCTTLQPSQARSGLMSVNQRSLALFLELCATACRNFSAVQMELAHSPAAAQLATSLTDYIPGPQTSRHARAIIGMLARHNSELASSLLRNMLGPAHSLTPAHAALAAELCTMRDEGIQGRIRLLWNFVSSSLQRGEQSPMLLPFFQALALAVEQYSISHGGDCLHATSERLSFIFDTSSNASMSDSSSNKDTSLQGFAQAAPEELVSLLIHLARSATASAPAEQAALTLLCSLVRCDSTLRKITMKNLEIMADDVISTIEDGKEFLQQTQAFWGQSGGDDEDLESVGSARSKGSQDGSEPRIGSSGSVGYNKWRGPCSTDIANAQSSLKILGMVCSCHPELVHMCQTVLTRLAAQIVPTMEVVHAVERGDVDSMISSLTSTRGEDSSSSTGGRLASPKRSGVPSTPSGTNHSQGVAIEIEQLLRGEGATGSLLDTPPSTPRGRSLPGSRSRIGLGARRLQGTSNRASFNSRKRVCESLRLLLQKTLGALSDAAKTEVVKSQLGDMGLLEELLNQLIEFDRAKTIAQNERKHLDDLLNHSRVNGSGIVNSSNSNLGRNIALAAQGSSSSGLGHIASSRLSGLDPSSKLSSGDAADVVRLMQESLRDDASNESLALAAASQAALVRVCEAWNECHETALDLMRSCLNLHPGNQTRVADLLVRQIEDNSGSCNFIVKILSEVAVIIPKVVVSMWQPQSVVEEIVNGALIGGSTTTSGRASELEEVSFRLDPDNCGSTISVSDDGMSATQISFEKWGMVRADMEIPSSGVSTWDVSIDTSPKGHIFVGVATANSNLGSYLGNDKHGWGYIGNKGAWHNKHKVKTYGKDFRSGHVVTVVMDMDEGILSFAVNGEDQGIAFDDGLKGKQLFPAFALYQKNDCFTVTNCSMAKVKSSDSSRGALSSASSSGVTDLSMMGSSGDLTSRLRFHRSGPIYTLPASLTVTEMLQLGGISVSQESDENLSDEVKQSRAAATGASISAMSPGSMTSELSLESWDENKPRVIREAPPNNKWGVLVPEGVMLVDHLASFTLSSLVVETELIDLVRISELPDDVRVLDDSALMDLATRNTSRTTAKHSILHKVAEMGGLNKLARLARTRLGLPARSELTDASRTELAGKSVTIETLSNGSVESKAVTWASWLDLVETYFEMSDFNRTFVGDRDCMGLLFVILGVDITGLSEEARARIEPSQQALQDPDGALFNALCKHFANVKGTSAIECRKWAVQNGVLDRALLRIGRIQAEDPRDPLRAVRFEDPFTARIPDGDRKSSMDDSDCSSRPADQTAETPSSSSAYLQKNVISVLKEGSKMKTSSSKSSSSLNTANAAPGGSGSSGGGGKDSDKTLWTPGYGHGSVDTSISDRMREKQQQEKTERTLATMNVLTSFLNMTPTTAANLGDEVWNEVLDILESSCLLRVLMSFLFGNTIKVVLDNVMLYRALLRLVYVMAKHPSLGRVLCPVDGIYRSIEQLMEELEDLIDDLSEEDEAEEGVLLQEETDIAKANWNDCSNSDGASATNLAVGPGEGVGNISPPATVKNSSSTPTRANVSDHPPLADLNELAFKDLARVVAGTVKEGAHKYQEAQRAEEERKRVEMEKLAAEAASSAEGLETQDQPKNSSTENAAGDGGEVNLDEEETKFMQNLHQMYETALRPELFGNRDMSDEDGRYNHHYRTQIEDDIKGKVSQTRMRRLNRELKALRKSLPLHFNSSIALRVDSKRPFVAQCVIFAPDNTPYDSGCFQFDIYFPPEYPSEPPKMNLMTTGSGQVRFNPNLYNNGKVCLSLLGTWRGGATGSENWTKNSSLWQVLVSIQSAILGSEFPYFNEPGVESQWGTDQGELQKRVHSNGGYERLRVATIQHAMIWQMRNPAPGFETLLQEHFRLKKHHILTTVDRWVEEAKSSDTKGHLKSMTKLVTELREELDKLPTEDVDELYDEREARLQQARAKEQKQLEQARLLEEEKAAASAASAKSDCHDEKEGESGSSSGIASEEILDSQMNDGTKVFPAASGWTGPMHVSSSSSLSSSVAASNTSANAGGSSKTQDVVQDSDATLSSSDKVHLTDDNAKQDDVDHESGETGAQGAFVSEFKAAHDIMMEMFPNHPPGLLRHALQESQDAETGGLDVEAAMNWVFAEGEQYLNGHLELYTETWGSNF